MATKANLKLAEELLDRFFRDGEGKTDHRIDLTFTLEDMGHTFEKAEPAIEYLESRGLIQNYGDVVLLTELALEVVGSETDIKKLPKAEKVWAKGEAPPAAVAAPEPEPEAPQQRPRPPKPMLSFVDAEGQFHSIELEWSCTIGRSPDTTFPLPDQRASKKHVEVNYAGDRYILKDLGSANGTLVNGGYVDVHPLQHGDILLIGRTEIYYDCPLVIAEPAGEPPEAITKTPGKPPPMGPPEHSMVPPPKAAERPEAILSQRVHPAPVRTAPPPSARAPTPELEERTERPAVAAKDAASTGSSPGRARPAPKPMRPVEKASDRTGPAPSAQAPQKAAPQKAPPAEASNVKVVKGRPVRVEVEDELIIDAPSGDLFDDGPKKPANGGDLFADRGGEDVDLFANEDTPPRGADLFGGGAKPKRGADLFGDTGQGSQDLIPAKPARKGAKGEDDLMITEPGTETALVEELMRSTKNQSVEIPTELLNPGLSDMLNLPRPGGAITAEEVPLAPEELPRWGEGKPAGSHPPFHPDASAPDLKRKGDFEERTPIDRRAQAIKAKTGGSRPADPASAEIAAKLAEDAAELPDAPINLDLPAELGPGAKAFAETLGLLRAKAQRASFPQQDEVLYALELLENHPYIQASLAEIERDH